MKLTVLAGLLVVATVAGVYAYVATARERSYRELINRGEAALGRDDGQAAIAAFSGAIAVKGDSMLGYLKRGEAYAGRGEYDAALPDLRQAAELDPASPRGQELLGDVNHAMQRYDRAARSYEAYLRLDDRSPRILYKLALAHYGAHQPSAAVAALRKAIALDDRFAEAHYLLGLCLRELDDSRAALASIERSVALAPALLQAREELADLYHALGRQSDRIKQLEALLALDTGPSRASREISLGLAYADAGRLENAVLRLGEATERYPDHAATYVALGRVWLEAAERDRTTANRRVSLTKALGALEHAVRQDEGSAVRTLFGRALLLAGEDPEFAERMLQQATERLPTDPSSFYYLAEAAERRGHFEVARRALVDYHSIGPAAHDNGQEVRVAERIADLSMRVNDPATAVRWYRRAAEGGTADLSLLTRLAEAQLHAGDVAGARVVIDDVLAKDPANRTALAMLRRLPS